MKRLALRVLMMMAMRDLNTEYPILRNVVHVLFPFRYDENNCIESADCVIQQSAVALFSSDPFEVFNSSLVLTLNEVVLAS